MQPINITKRHRDYQLNRKVLINTRNNSKPSPYPDIDHKTAAKLLEKQEADCFSAGHLLFNLYRRH